MRLGGCSCPASIRLLAGLALALSYGLAPARAIVDGYGESPGLVKWLKTEDLLKHLRDSKDQDSLDNTTRTFAFDQREGGHNSLLGCA